MGVEGGGRGEWRDSGLYMLKGCGEWQSRNQSHDRMYSCRKYHVRIASCVCVSREVLRQSINGREFSSW